MTDPHQLLIYCKMKETRTERAIAWERQGRKAGDADETGVHRSGKKGIWEARGKRKSGEEHYCTNSLNVDG